jgi:uncharacterized protein YdhG (YjbR/CyaY superfamily)
VVVKPANLEQYIASLDEVRGTTVQRIVDAILAEYPSATVKIAWNVPQIQIDGEYVFGISAATHHLMLASWNPDALDTFAERLSGYEVNKRTFRIPVDWSVDRELLRDMIADRLAQLGQVPPGTR